MTQFYLHNTSNYSANGFNPSGTFTGQKQGITNGAGFAPVFFVNGEENIGLVGWKTALGAVGAFAPTDGEIAVECKVKLRTPPINPGISYAKWLWHIGDNTVPFTSGGMVSCYIGQSGGLSFQYGIDGNIHTIVTFQSSHAIVVAINDGQFHKIRFEAKQATPNLFQASDIVIKFDGVVATPDVLGGNAVGTWNNAIPHSITLGGTNTNNSPAISIGDFFLSNTKTAIPDETASCTGSNYVDVNFNFIDFNSESVDVTPKYSVTGAFSGEEQDLTVVTADGANSSAFSSGVPPYSLYADADGEIHNLVWDAHTDLGGSFSGDIYLKYGISDALLTTNVYGTGCVGFNIAPTGSIDFCTQRTNNTGYVDVDFTVKDANSDPVNVAFYVSTTGSFAGEQVAMTMVTGDPLHTFSNPVAATPTGVSKSIVWDARADLPQSFDGAVYFKFILNDGIESSDILFTFMAEHNDGPTITSLTSVQRLNSHADVSFVVSDDDADSIDVDIQYSLTGAFAGEELPLTAVPLDLSHTYIDPAGSNSSGIPYNFVWNVATDLGAGFNDTIYIRVYADDSHNPIVYANTSFAVIVNTPPQCNLVSAIQRSGVELNLVDLTLVIADADFNPLSVTLYSSGTGDFTGEELALSLVPLDASHTLPSNPVPSIPGGTTYVAVWNSEISLPQFGGTAYVKLVVSDGLSSASSTINFFLDNQSGLLSGLLCAHLLYENGSEFNGGQSLQFETRNHFGFKMPGVPKFYDTDQPANLGGFYSPYSQDVGCHINTNDDEPHWSTRHYGTRIKPFIPCWSTFNPRLRGYTRSVWAKNVGKGPHRIPECNQRHSKFAAIDMRGNITAGGEEVFMGMDFVPFGSGTPQFGFGEGYGADRTTHASESTVYDISRDGWNLYTIVFVPAGTAMSSHPAGGADENVLFINAVEVSRNDVTDINTLNPDGFLETREITDIVGQKINVMADIIPHVFSRFGNHGNEHDRHRGRHRRDGWGGHPDFYGFAQLATWDRALTQAQISLLHNNGWGTRYFQNSASNPEIPSAPPVPPLPPVVLENVTIEVNSAIKRPLDNLVDVSFTVTNNSSVAINAFPSGSGVPGNSDLEVELTHSASGYFIGEQQIMTPTTDVAHDFGTEVIAANGGEKTFNYVWSVGVDVGAGWRNNSSNPYYISAKISDDNDSKEHIVGKAIDLTGNTGLSYKYSEQFGDNKRPRELNFNLAMQVFEPTSTDIQILSILCHTNPAFTGPGVTFTLTPANHKKKLLKLNDVEDIEIKNDISGGVDNVGIAFDLSSYFTETYAGPLYMKFFFKKFGTSVVKQSIAATAISLGSRDFEKAIDSAKKKLKQHPPTII